MTETERLWTEHVRRADLSADMAKQIFRAEDPNHPIHTREQFIRLIAAFASYYRKDLFRKVHNSTTIHNMLCSAVTPARIEMYLNNVRMRTHFTSAENPRLPVGTTSNEALHAQLGMWLHKTTVITKALLMQCLKVILLREMRVNSRQLQLPMFRGYRHSVVAHKACFDSGVFTWELWEEHRTHKQGRSDARVRRADRLRVVRAVSVPPSTAMLRKSDQLLGISLGEGVDPGPRPLPPPPPKRFRSVLRRPARA